jgi:hypothetical protein
MATRETRQNAVGTERRCTGCGEWFLLDLDREGDRRRKCPDCIAETAEAREPRDVAMQLDRPASARLASALRWGGYWESDG